MVLFFLQNKISGKELVIIQPDYHYHDWGNYIKKARKIDIVANYFDSWLRKYQVEITDFLKRGGRIRIVMTKTDDLGEMALVMRRFPDMKEIEELNFRIKNTSKVLEEILKKNKLPVACVEVYYYASAISYPAVRIDDRLIIFSYFKHNPEIEFDAPSILLNIENDLSTRRFWAKEFEFFFQNSNKINLTL